MRIAFRKRCLDLKFDSVSVEGKLTEDQKRYISATITDKKKEFSFNQAKRGYYRVLSTNAVQSFFPTAELGKDSLFTLRLQTTPKNVLSLSVGGNISSSSLMQGYVGLSHIHFSKHPWNAAINLDIGQFFTGAGLYFRQHIGIKPLFLYEVMLNAQSFDYFRSSQGILQSNSLARNIRETEYFLTLNMGTPISYNSNILLEFGATAGVNRYDYFPADNYTQYDKKDKTWLSYLTARLKMAQTTLDYDMYPSSGRHRLLEFRYILSHERHSEGTMYADGTSVTQPLKSTFLARLNLEDYSVHSARPERLHVDTYGHAGISAYGTQQDADAWGIPCTYIYRPYRESCYKVYKDSVSASVRRLFPALYGTAGNGGRRLYVFGPASARRFFRQCRDSMAVPDRSGVALLRLLREGREG